MPRPIAYALLGAVVCAAAGCGLLGLGGPTPPPLPMYTCERAAGKITVDGKLDEPSWAKARAMDLALREGTGAPKHPATAKAMWDDQYLYVAFLCKDPDIWATKTQRDDPLWQEEVVEVFLDPTGAADPYFEIEVNPLNVVVDLRLMRGLKGLNSPGSMRTKAWDCQGMLTAVHVKGTVQSWKADQDPDGEWAVEMAIPFNALDSLPNSPPKHGDTWRANFYRIDRPAALGEGDDEYSCWSPIVVHKSFHTVERFGYLRFSTELVGADAAPPRK